MRVKPCSGQSGAGCLELVSTMGVGEIYKQLLQVVLNQKTVSLSSLSMSSIWKENISRQKVVFGVDLFFLTDICKNLKIKRLIDI